MKSRRFAVKAVALLTLTSGIVNIASVIGRTLPHRFAILTQVLPLEFVHLSKSLTLLIGFALAVSAINIYKRKRRAFHIVILLSCLSIPLHLTKGLDYEGALASLVLVAVLVLNRKRFTVKSSVPSLRWGLIRFGVISLLVSGYGVAGFWFLDRREFGVEFHVGDALRETLLYLTLAGDARLIPHSHHAHWFLDSLYLTTTVSILYALYAIFRPVIYQFGMHHTDRSLAKEIVEKHGRSALDFFKYWPDKSYFVSSSQNSFIAYRVGNSFALALADPVGPEEEMEDIIGGFVQFCEDNDWGVGFYQTLPDFLPIYEGLGFRKLKIGDDAVVDLTGFGLTGKERKELRHTMNRMEGMDMRFIRYQPPIGDETIAQAKEVSDEWLSIPGRRERQFTLGVFDPSYVRSTPLNVAADSGGRIIAFVNEIPSYRTGEATVDLMRHRTDAPKDVMDYLFVKLFFCLKETGFQRFNLGMAPMGGFRENEHASVEERAIHYFFQHIKFLFSYRGLRQYKAKFASSWEPRYVVYKSPLDLPKIALGLREVSKAGH
ncbi:MAG: phosphatidylglycerol lysyltransferase domain-containing protein [Candidatus Zixiibacteriota bacterium]